MLAVMVIGIPNTFKIGFLAGAVGLVIGTIIGLFAGTTEATRTRSSAASPT